MRKILQLTLLLSCLVMLCSHSSNAIGNVDVWNTEHTLEERFSDIDNHDLDGGLSKTVLFTAWLSRVEKNILFEKNSNKTRLTFSFIRAPPKKFI
jgi:hypothetical protein